MSAKPTYQELEKQLQQLHKEHEVLKQSNTLEKLKETQLLLKSSIESAQGMIALSVDKNYKYLYFNDTHKYTMKSIYGCDVEVGLNILDCITVDEDKDKIKQNYDKALSGEAHSTIEEYGEGSKYFYESYFNPIVNEHNQVIGVTVLALNISSKVEADLALTESESRFKAMMYGINDVIGIVGTDGVLKYKSSNTERLFGWKVEDLIGLDAFANVHPADLVNSQENMFYIFENIGSSETFEFRYLHKNGSYKWVSLHAINKLDDSSINGILINYHEITERKEAEQALKKSETLYKSLFDNLSSSSSLYEVILDRKGEAKDYRFIAVNPIYEMSFGFKEADLIGKTLLEIFPSTEKEWLQTFKQVFESGISTKIQDYSVEMDMYFEIIAYVPQKGQLALIGSDITERKKHELAILENQRLLKQQNEEYLKLNEDLKERNRKYAELNEKYKVQNKELQLSKEKAEESDYLKTEFLNNMSHEVRTPMNGIVGFAQLLDMPDLDYKTRKYYTNIIQQSSDQLLSIIDNIIEISKLGTKQVKVFNEKVHLNKMLSELYAIFNIEAENKKIKLNLFTELIDKDCIVLIDSVKLYKVLSNLLENALKYTDEGSVDFGYRILTSKIDTNTSKKTLQFFVKDTGIGVDKEKQEKIFEKFSQVNSNLSRQFRGLGLGLSIAKQNTELMHGTINLVSEKNVGSEFMVNLPLVR